MKRGWVTLRIYELDGMDPKVTVLLKPCSEKTGGVSEGHVGSARSRIG